MVAAPRAILSPRWTVGFRLLYSRQYILIMSNRRRISPSIQLNRISCVGMKGEGGSNTFAAPSCFLICGLVATDRGFSHTRKYAPLADLCFALIFWAWSVAAVLIRPSLFFAIYPAEREDEVSNVPKQAAFSEGRRFMPNNPRNLTQLFDYIQCSRSFWGRL